MVKALFACRSLSPCNNPDTEINQLGHNVHLWRDSLTTPYQCEREDASVGFRAQSSSSVCRDQGLGDGSHALRCKATYTVSRTYWIFQYMMEHQRVGRGGAGNFYNSQELEKASKETTKVGKSSDLFSHNVDDSLGRRSSVRCCQWSSQISRERGSQSFNLWSRWCWQCYDERCASSRHYCEY